MLKIEEGIIYLTRGDDAVLQVDVELADGSAYELQSGDSLTLTVRADPTPESPVLFSTTAAPGSNRIIINAADTSPHEQGRYSADIQLNTADGKRCTIWPELEGSKRYSKSNLKNFIIMPEVTST